MMPLMIQVKKMEYKNMDATENLIRYITRTRPNENRAHELLLYGGYYGFMYHKPVEELISEFEDIQKQYGTSGSLMCHYVMRISPTLFADMNNDLYRLSVYACECCRYIFHLGYQSCFAIHNSEEDKLHVHFAISTTNFHTGRKLRQYPKEIKKNLEEPLCQMSSKYHYSPPGVLTLDDL